MLRNIPTTDRGDDHLIYQQEIQNYQMALGNIQSRLLQRNVVTLHEVEFKVFSQWGQDGIIQFLINTIPIENKIFIEFGVNDYRESNTRFLLMNNNWRGLILDGGVRHLDFLCASGLRWKYDIEPMRVFVTRENINPIIQKTGISGDIGLLSIDIDGMDYWVLEAIDIVAPRILIVEYNSTFGCEHAITVPYRPDFDRTVAHYSNLYFGASLSAIVCCANKKGYSFVGCNSAGNDAFFVRNDVLNNSLRVLEPQEGYVESKFAESRDEIGNFSYIRPIKERLKLISGMPVYDVIKNETITIGDIFG